MIKLHPTDTKLVSFAEGDLSSAGSLLVSAHCDMCKDCRHKVMLFTDNLASQVFCDEDDHKSISREFVSMFESITHNSDLIDVPDTQDAHQTIELEGRKFIIPATLGRFSNRMGEWSHLVGKIWQSSVDIGGGYLAQFIYMEKGGSVPEHTHKGNEYTIVLDGQFKDGNAVYESGDYIALNNSDVHAPVSEVDEGCLVFSVIDSPLYFTSGWAKLINPLSHIYFKVKCES